MRDSGLVLPDGSSSSWDDAVSALTGGMPKPRQPCQLFFSSVPANVSEVQLSALFGQFGGGGVQRLQLLRSSETGVSSGSGFVLMPSRDTALAAVEMLDQAHKFDGALQPMSVVVAAEEYGAAVTGGNEDGCSTTHRQSLQPDPNADNRVLFFAKVLRSSGEEDVHSLFANYGRVFDVNLFRAYQGASTTKGCGLVTMGTHEEAAAAIDALHDKYMWAGMESAMVVKWMDTALQRRRREQHLTAMRAGLTPGLQLVPTGGYTYGTTTGGRMLLPPSAGPAPPLAGGGGQPLLAAAATAAGLGLGGSGSAAAGGADFGDGGETPPVGCHLDAIKLFVGNVPKSCTEEQLQPFFETIGKVIELVIVRDKASQESKGSAFVWYMTRAQAERAILQFNLRHVLPDPSGQQDRPLVVRKAKSRPPGPRPGRGPGGFLGTLGGLAGGIGGSGIGAGMHPSVSMLTQGGGHPALSPLSQPNSYYHPGGAGLGHSSVSGAQSVMVGHMGRLGLDGLSQQDSNGHLQAAQQASLINMSMYRGLSNPGLSGMATLQHGGHTLGAIGPGAGVGGVGVALSGSYDGYGAGMDSVVDHYGMPQMTVAPVSGMDLNQVSLTMPLNQHQLGAVNNHLFSVQTVSGTQLHITPGGSGLFHLVVLGNNSAVETARNLVASVLSQTSGHAHGHNGM